MSDYFLADDRAEERKRQRELHGADRLSLAKPQELKARMQGDFLIPLSESTGSDPYNSQQGKGVRDAWDQRRRR